MSEAKARWLLIFGAFVAFVALVGDKADSPSSHGLKAKSTEKVATSRGRDKFVWDERLYWGEGDDHDKSLVRKGAEIVWKNNPRCHRVEVVAPAKSRSKPGDPVWFITCSPSDGSSVFNIFYSLNDVADEKEIPKVKNVSGSDAIKACREWTKKQINYPSTLDFNEITGTTVHHHNNGRTTVRSDSTAKNGFGVEIGMKVRCLVDRTGVLDGTLIEN